MRTISVLNHIFPAAVGWTGGTYNQPYQKRQKGLTIQVAQPCAHLLLRLCHFVHGVRQSKCYDPSDKLTEVVLGAGGFANVIVIAFPQLSPEL